MGEPMSDQRRSEIEQAIRNAVVPNAGWVVIAEDLWAEVDRLTAENERLRGIEAAAQRWGRAFTEQADTLAAWQDERRRGITSATRKYDATNAAYRTFRDESETFAAALAAASPEETP